MQTSKMPALRHGEQARRIRSTSDITSFIHVTIPCHLHKKPQSWKSPRSALALPRPALVFVTPNGICSSPKRAAQLVEEVIHGGVTVVQLRDCLSAAPSFSATAEEVARRVRAPGMLVLNGLERIKVANEIGGNVGIHIRENEIAAAKKDETFCTLCRQDVVVGCSVHSVEAAKLALECFPDKQLSYLQVGTMYKSSSHPGKTPEGVALLSAVQEVCDTFTSLVGIGGINKDNLSAVVCANGTIQAHGIAVISAIASTDDPRTETLRIRNRIQVAYRSCRIL